MVFSSAAAPFKGLCLGRVFQRMARSCLLPREAKALQQTPQRGRVEGLAKAGFADAHKVLARKRRKPALEIGAFKHDADQLGLLMRFKPWRATIAPAIVKAVEAVRVIADPFPLGANGSVPLEPASRASSAC